MNNSSSEPNDLSGHLGRMNWDIEPDRDLWPDISSQIKFQTRRKRSKLVRQRVWLPTAIAASLVVAVCAVWFSSFTYQQTTQLQTAAAQHFKAELVRYQQAQLQLVEQQHQVIRLQLTAFIETHQNNLNPALVAEARGLMQIIDLATSEIKTAMLLQPDNPVFTSMLVRTYQKEASLLSQISSTNRFIIAEPS